MKNKIVLVFPVINPSSQFFWFPFSCLAIGASLKVAGFNVIIIDQRTQKDWRQRLKHEIQDVLFVGISAMTGHQIIGAWKLLDW